MMIRMFQPDSMALTQKRQLGSLWYLKTQSAAIDGNGNVVNSYSHKTGHVGRTTLAQLIRDGDQRPGFIYVYGMDLGYFTTPDAHILFVQGFLVGGKPIAVLWNQSPEYCLEACVSNLTPTGSFFFLRTGSDTEVDGATYASRGIGYHVGTLLANAPDAIKAQIARFNNLYPNSKPTKVQEAIKRFERELITFRDNAAILSYLLTGDEGNLGTNAPYVIRSASQVTIPTNGNDEDSQGGLDIFFFAIVSPTPSK
jgi:hypothetical protein